VAAFDRLSRGSPKRAKDFGMDSIYFLTFTLATLAVIFWAVQNEKNPKRPDTGLFGMK
jgi:hypothetical protein